MDPRAPTYDQLSALCAQMAAALSNVEAIMSIIEPRSDKAEYLNGLTEVRAALSAYRTLSPDPQWQRVPVGYEVVAKTPAAVVNPDDAPMTEEKLVNMMRDPRYWKTRDPEILANVTEGFRRLYPDNRARGEG